MEEDTDAGGAEPQSWQGKVLLADCPTPVHGWWKPSLATSWKRQRGCDAAVVAHGLLGYASTPEDTPLSLLSATTLSFCPFSVQVSAPRQDPVGSLGQAKKFLCRSPFYRGLHTSSRAAVALQRLSLPIYLRLSIYLSLSLEREPTGDDRCRKEGRWAPVLCWSLKVSAGQMFLFTLFQDNKKNQSLGKSIWATMSCVRVFQFFHLWKKEGKAENLQSFGLSIGKRGYLFFFCFKLVLRLEGYLNQNKCSPLLLPWKCFIFSWAKHLTQILTQITFFLFSHVRKQNRTKNSFQVFQRQKLFKIPLLDQCTVKQTNKKANSQSPMIAPTGKEYQAFI